MLTAFQEHLHDHFSNLREKRLLIAISGGLDSVVLTHLLFNTGYKIALAHCNFHLRSSESDQDEQFVRQLAGRLKMDCHVAQFDTLDYASKRGVSTQMAARELRYDFFDDLCNDHNYDYLLTAHHLDDQIETFFINLNRGAGLNGLQGIPRVNGRVIRPLLPFSREQIQNYAIDAQISWREDSSNSSNKYQRNQLRNQILPLLHEALPQFKTHFAQSLGYLKGSQDLVNDAVLRFRESVIKTTPTGIKINLSQLKTFSNPQAYLYEVVKAYGFYNMKDVMNIVDGQSGKRIESDQFVLFKDRERVVIEELRLLKPIELTIDDSCVQYHFYDASIDIEKINVEDANAFVKDNHDKNVLFLDASQVCYPLILRSWKNGDRIKPLGMKGSKLVSDVLTDSKVSFIAKEKIVVLTWEDEILWIVGIRSSRHGKVTSSTNQLLKITYKI
ncbi:tRNA lysidine(34) synthetase TilS [Nonlabens ulvanivorans]|uniref:tRNA lysidine(34) synthetase TilS n=1 Tax=Nonlabens ulvanivorans TaxID=906888 RepID=UPI002941E9C6|nr:tRNA lysidine(34) synthetase TilS [Nonlabens ulvanivorans]WOI24034.1 tRNA lysidine(34) synthetase TilS [Nonlabens ulvanivorans]